MSCPIKVNNKAIELTVQTFCLCILDLVYILDMVEMVKIAVVQPVSNYFVTSFEGSFWWIF